MIPYMVGKLAPNSSHLTRGLVKYVLGRDYFRAVSSQNGDTYVKSPPLPIVELVGSVEMLVVSIARARCSRRNRSHLETTVSSAFLFLAEHAAIDPKGCSESPVITLALSPCLRRAAPPPPRIIRHPRCTPRRRERRAVALHPRAKLG